MGIGIIKNWNRFGFGILYNFKVPLVMIVQLSVFLVLIVFSLKYTYLKLFYLIFNSQIRPLSRENSNSERTRHHSLWSKKNPLCFWNLKLPTTLHFIGILSNGFFSWYDKIWGNVTGMMFRSQKQVLPKISQMVGCISSLWNQKKKLKPKGQKHWCLVNNLI